MLLIGCLFVGMIYVSMGADYVEEKKNDFERKVYAESISAHARSSL